MKDACVVPKGVTPPTLQVSSQATFLSLTMVFEKHALDDFLGFLQPRLCIFFLGLEQGLTLWDLVVADLGLERIDLLLLQVDLLLLPIGLGLLHLSNRLELSDLHKKELQVLGQTKSLHGVTRILHRRVGDVVDVLHVPFQTLRNGFLHSLPDGLVLLGTCQRDRSLRQLEGQALLAAN